MKNTKCLVLNQVFPLNSENTTRFCSTPIKNLEVGGGGGAFEPYLVGGWELKLKVQVFPLEKTHGSECILDLNHH